MSTAMLHGLPNSVCGLSSHMPFRSCSDAHDCSRFPFSFCGKQTYSSSHCSIFDCRKAFVNCSPIVPCKFSAIKGKSEGSSFHPFVPSITMGLTSGCTYYMVTATTLRSHHPHRPWESSKISDFTGQGKCLAINKRIRESTETLQ